MHLCSGKRRNLAPALTLDLLQSEVGREMSRRFDETSAAIDPENRPGRTDALAQEMQNAPRAASNIDDPLTGLDPDFFQLGVGIRRQISDLPLEALLLASAAPKQIKIRFGQIKALIKKWRQLITHGQPVVICKVRRLTSSSFLPAAFPVIDVFGRRLFSCASRPFTVERLPKYAPELNEIEPVWRDLKARHLAHQTFTDVAALDQAIHDAVIDLNRERIPDPWPCPRIFA